MGARAIENDGSRETVLRYLAMAQAVPQEPHRRTANDVVRRLKNEGFKCDKRTVERDLWKLMSVFHYEWTTEGRTNYWYYPRDTRSLFEVPGMNTACALALALSQDYLRPLLPPATLDLAKSYFQRAETVLEEAVQEKFSAWRKRICVITPGPGLKHPKVSPIVQAAVYDAVLCSQQLEVDYLARGASEAAKMTLHPQGLVVRDGVIYLVACAWDYTDLRHYALHRIRKAQVQDGRARAAADLDFAAYVESAFRYPVSPERINLQLSVEAGLVTHLEERPLSADQKIMADGENAIVVATVPDTDELRWWLLGFGAQVEVLKPRSLRNDMARTAEQMSARYAANPRARPAGRS